jgi:hypothetical protein
MNAIISDQNFAGSKLTCVVLVAARINNKESGNPIDLAILLSDVHDASAADETARHTSCQMTVTQSRAKKKTRDW